MLGCDMGQEEAILSPREALAIVGKLLAALPDSAHNGMLSLSEAADLLGYTEKGLRNLVKRRAIQYCQPRPHGPIKFKREWIEAFTAPKVQRVKVQGARAQGARTQGAKRRSSKPLTFDEFLVDSGQ